MPTNYQTTSSISMWRYCYHILGVILVSSDLAGTVQQQTVPIGHQLKVCTKIVMVHTPVWVAKGRQADPSVWLTETARRTQQAMRHHRSCARQKYYATDPGKRHNMPEKLISDAAIRDSETKRVTNNLSVTRVDETRHWLAVAHAPGTRHVTNNIISVTLE
jgi:hypothetical protein